MNRLATEPMFGHRPRLPGDRVGQVGHPEGARERQPSVPDHADHAARPVVPVVDARQLGHALCRVDRNRLRDQNLDPAPAARAFERGHLDHVPARRLRLELERLHAAPPGSVEHAQRRAGGVLHGDDHVHRLADFAVHEHSLAQLDGVGVEGVAGKGGAGGFVQLKRPRRDERAWRPAGRPRRFGRSGCS